MKFAESLENGPHASLAKFAGEWTGTTKTWFEPDVVADESPMTGTIKVILGGRFLMHEYSGSLQGKVFDGVAIFGFDIATNKFQMAWVDSFHMSTGIMFSEGDGADKFSAFGTYFTGPDTPRWGWRTELEQVDDDNIVITAYNVEPDSDDQIATETRYTRC